MRTIEITKTTNNDAVLILKEDGIIKAFYPITLKNPTVLSWIKEWMVEGRIPHTFF